MCKDCGCGASAHVHHQEFVAPEMHCEHCEQAVQKAVLGLAGVMSCDIDLTTKTVSVAYDANVIAPLAIKEAIEDTGFDVESMSEAHHA